MGAKCKGNLLCVSLKNEILGNNDFLKCLRRVKSEQTSVLQQLFMFILWNMNICVVILLVRISSQWPFLSWQPLKADCWISISGYIKRNCDFIRSCFRRQWHITLENKIIKLFSNDRHSTAVFHCGTKQNIALGI